ncbi:MAG: aminotransferase class III-fold pyridoxal phosphate-dependent enzyme [Candidatus Promineifilaceae bacterium]
MTQELLALAEKYLVPTYARPQIVFTHGEGAYLYDDAGNRYLDFVAGIAVNALGHADPAWAQVVAEQATQLIHLSNLYHNVPQLLLAQKLVENSFADKLFFSNTGAEANEAALKFARKYARVHHGEGKTGFVAFSHSFHGRTMGALAVTHKAKYREPFAPLLPGVTFAEYNDLAGASAAIGAETCAVIVEPIQGEGGVHAAAPNFLRGLRALCDEQDALLIFDEVQCGIGRTGHLWAHQALGVTPDMMTIAKPLAGGLPLGAALVTDKGRGRDSAR